MMVTHVPITSKYINTILIQYRPFNYKRTTIMYSITTLNNIQETYLSSINLFNTGMFESLDTLSKVLLTVPHYKHSNGVVYVPAAYMVEHQVLLSNSDICIGVTHEDKVITSKLITSDLKCLMEANSTVYKMNIFDTIYLMVNLDEPNYNYKLSPITTINTDTKVMKHFSWNEVRDRVLALGMVNIDDKISCQGFIEYLTNNLNEYPVHKSIDAYMSLLMTNTLIMFNNHEEEIEDLLKSL